MIAVDEWKVSEVLDELRANPALVLNRNWLGKRRLRASWWLCVPGADWTAYRMERVSSRAARAAFSHRKTEHVPGKPDAVRAKR